MTGERYTCAHWGSYQVESEQANLHLTPLASDPQPSVIGGGWLEAIRDERARIRTPRIRKGWLERRDRFTRNGD